MVVVLSALFLLTEALPGDFADRLAGPDHERAERLRAQHGLDLPALLRLGRWWLHALQGDLGTSLINDQPVLPRVVGRLITTLAVAAPAAVLAAVLGCVLAFVMAWCQGRRRGTWISAAVAVIAGLPEVVLVIALVLLLAVTLKLVPPVSLTTPGAGPWARWEILVLPVLALTLPHAAWGARMLRGTADDILAGYVVTSARRRGVPGWRIAWAHVLPRWWGPILHTTAYLTAGILGGSVVVESMLAYAGLGQLLADAVASRDTPTVQAAGTIVVGISLALFTGADLLSRVAETRGLP